MLQTIICNAGLLMPRQILPSKHSFDTGIKLTEYGGLYLKITYLSLQSPPRN